MRTNNTINRNTENINSRNGTPSTNISIQNTGNDALDLKLIQIEINATFILILACGLAIVSANRARQTILLREQGLEEPKNMPNSTQIATFASSLNLIANSILAEIAFTRLKEIEDQIKSGNTSSSTIPNINISTGFVFSVLANALKTLGGFQRIQEQAQITIF